jgi:hypothetical protein
MPKAASAKPMTSGTATTLGQRERGEDSAPDDSPTRARCG